LSTPNDPSAEQWWFSKIGLDKTWDKPTGNYQTTLAIIDTGFALNHEEFSNRFYQNSGETGVAISENPSQLNCSDQNIPLDPKL
jgi:subtilisin family serine protease